MRWYIVYNAHIVDCNNNNKIIISHHYYFIIINYSHCVVGGRMLLLLLYLLFVVLLRNTLSAHALRPPTSLSATSHRLDLYEMHRKSSTQRGFWDFDYCVSQQRI